MSDTDPDLELLALKWYSETKRNQSHGDLAPEISKMLSQSTDENERKALFGMLASEHQSFQRYEKATQTILKEILEFPDSVRARIILSVHYLYFQEDEVKALEALENAVEISYKHGRYYRESLGNRARFGIKYVKRDILRDSIEKIISYGWSEDQLDSGLERDFIDYSPTDLIELDLIQKYEIFLKECKERKSELGK